MEDQELTVGMPGIQVTVRCAGDVWAAARAALGAAQQAVENDASFRPTQGKRNEALSRRTQAEQVRDVARGVLSDGRLHKRREIVQAVRAAGLSAQTLTKTLAGHFERGENADGIFYRDPKTQGQPAGEFPIHRIEDLIAETNGGHPAL